LVGWLVGLFGFATEET